MRKGEISTPAELAAEWKCSERALRRLARKIGACRVLGKSMILTDADQAALLEAMRCPSPSTDARAEQSGITAVQLPDIDYEALVELRTRQERSASRPRRKPATGKVIWMDPARS